MPTKKERKKKKKRKRENNKMEKKEVCLRVKSRFKRSNLYEPLKTHYLFNMRINAMKNKSTKKSHLPLNSGQFIWPGVEMYKQKVKTPQNGLGAPTYGHENLQCREKIGGVGNGWKGYNLKGFKRL